jgi:hypothetical protein
LSLSIKFLALLTVPSTENRLPASTHATSPKASSRRSLSTTTLMPCLSQRSLASSSDLACSLALFASSSAQALDRAHIKSYKYKLLDANRLNFKLSNHES